MPVRNRVFESRIRVYQNLHSWRRLCLKPNLGKPSRHHWKGRTQVHWVPLLRRKDQGIQLQRNGPDFDQGQKGIHCPPPRLCSQPNWSRPNSRAMEAIGSALQGKGTLPLLRFSLLGICKWRPWKRRHCHQNLLGRRLIINGFIKFCQKYGTLWRKSRSPAHCRQIQGCRWKGPFLSQACHQTHVFQPSRSRS